MTSHDDPGMTRRDILEAYKAAAWAEADAHFDERTLEAQRLRILARIEQGGQRAKVLPFPGAAPTGRLVGGSSRRWISAAAAAGLLVGLLTGQLLHVMPGDNWVHPERRTLTQQSTPALRSVVPAVATASLDPDDMLLDAIDRAVAQQSITDLRAFDDLTFSDPE
jgi:hypothetical protein